MPASSRTQARHHLISALLQASGPLSREELSADDDLLSDLLAEGLVAAGRWEPARPFPQYYWAARWHEELRRRTARAKQDLRSRLADVDIRADVFGEAARIYSDYVIHDYQPPADKRLLVFLQCAVRRPFSSAPSHASMRRAISLATGRDPHHDFEACPVHVVVLASEVGPAPYELEDIPPVNISALGVKQFGPDRYAHARPLLAQRMADYLLAHRDCYDHAATFTDGRYAEVMQEARTRAGCDLTILPRLPGPTVARCGRSTPRRYWEKYWIQLYLEIVGWLPPRVQAEAAARLQTAKVKWR